MTTQEATRYRINEIHQSKIFALASYLQAQYPLLTRIDAIREAKRIISHETI